MAPGIHASKLLLSQFQKLELLDIRNNLIDDQFNIIVVRNWKKLQRLHISGNPFASKSIDSLKEEINKNYFL